MSGENIREGDCNLALSALRLVAFSPSVNAIFVAPPNISTKHFTGSLQVSVQTETLPKDIALEGEAKEKLSSFESYLRKYFTFPRDVCEIKRFTFSFSDKSVSVTLVVARYHVEKENAQAERNALRAKGYLYHVGKLEYVKKKGDAYPFYVALPLCDEEVKMLQSFLTSLPTVQEPASLPTFLKEVDNDLVWLKKSELLNEGEFLLVYGVVDNVVIPENVLRYAGLIEERGVRMYIDRRALSRLYVVIYTYDTHQELGALSLFDGNGVPPMRFEEYRQWEEIWTTALSTAPPLLMPQLSVEASRVSNWESRVIVRSARFTIRLERRSRYILAQIETKLNVPVDSIVGILRNFGFQKGQYGGYIRYQQLSLEEEETLLNALRDAVTQLLPLIRESVARAIEIEHKDACDRIANARAQVGLGHIPPTQPVMPADILRLFSLTPRETRVAEAAAMSTQQVPQATTAVVATTPAPQREVVTVKQEVKVIPVRGFLLSSNLPSTALLDAHLPEIFKDSRVGTKIVQFVRGWFYNRLKSLSRDFYTRVLPEYAYSTPFGYIIPAHRVGEFQRAVEEMRRKYEEYERALKDFLLHGKLPDYRDPRAKIDVEYVNLVKEYLEQHGYDEAFEKRVHSLNIADRFRVFLIPFALDENALPLLYDLLDENVKKEVEEHMRKVKEEMTKEVEEQLRERCKKLLERFSKLEKPSEAVLEMLRRELEVLEKDAGNLGVKAELVAEFVALKEKIASAISAAPSASSERAKALVSF
ncbi:MAG: hypothetical protein QW794_06780 [Thermosphaera sp.]